MSLREIIKEEYLVISEELENVLNSIGEDLPIKLVKEDKEYKIISGYGVYENYWYLVIANTSILKDIEEEPFTSKNLEFRIDYIKDEMIEEDYTIEDVEFLAIENLDDYKIDDYYMSSDIKNYFIKDVYIKNKEVIIEIASRK